MPVVPKQHKECLDTEKGLYYEGTKSTTASGKTCMKWSDVFGKGEQSNYCRNKLGKWEKPGCYVEDNEKELCDIPMCRKWQMC